jgi:hypothetical protein
MSQGDAKGQQNHQQSQKTGGEQCFSLHILISFFSGLIQYSAPILDGA